MQGQAFDSPMMKANAFQTHNSTIKSSGTKKSKQIDPNVTLSAPFHDSSNNEYTDDSLNMRDPVTPQFTPEAIEG